MLGIVADRCGWLGTYGRDWLRYNGKTFVVTHVRDARTLEIGLAGGGMPIARLRLWGIDIPGFTRDPVTPSGQLHADNSLTLARVLARGQFVNVLLEPHRLRASDGDLLAHVVLTDGTRMSERLLAAGLARVGDEVDHRWRERFALLELQARHDAVGMWAVGR